MEDELKPKPSSYDIELEKMRLELEKRRVEWGVLSVLGDTVKK